MENILEKTPQYGKDKSTLWSQSIVLVEQIKGWFTLLSDSIGAMNTYDVGPTPPVRENTNGVNKEYTHFSNSLLLYIIVFIIGYIIILR